MHRLRLRLTFLRCALTLIKRGNGKLERGYFLRRNLRRMLEHKEVMGSIQRTPVLGVLRFVTAADFVDPAPLIDAAYIIRVDISSSNFPEFSNHTNTVGNWAEQTTYQIALPLECV